MVVRETTQNNDIRTFRAQLLHIEPYNTTDPYGPCVEDTFSGFSLNNRQSILLAIDEMWMLRLARHAHVFIFGGVNQTKYYQPRHIQTRKGKRIQNA